MPMCVGRTTFVLSIRIVWKSAERDRYGAVGERMAAMLHRIVG